MIWTEQKVALCGLAFVLWLKNFIWEALRQFGRSCQVMIMHQWLVAAKFCFSISVTHVTGTCLFVISPHELFPVVPGIVNRTFENRTQSNSIELNPWIEFDWVRQSNEIEHHTFSEFDFRTNRIQSNKSNSIELNPSDCVRLSSETELNRTQLNGFRSIGSGEPIQSKPKSSPSKQVFLALFLLFI